MTDYLSKEDPLINRIKLIIENENLDTERAFIRATTAELGIDNITYAAALTYLNQIIENTSAPILKEDNKTTSKPLPSKAMSLSVKMVRYRLDVGTKHQVTLEQLKKVLIEESGVDKNNINNVNIQSLYTLIELPDEMPPDIFQHLKSVEINQHKLDIRRVKARNNKKRGNFHMHRRKKGNLKPVKEISDRVNSNKMID
jgi:hypothetical protein